jgi:hypothetical protein
MPIPIRGIWMDAPMRDALKEYAWLNRTNMSAVLRAAITNVRDNPGDESVLSDDDRRSELHVNVKIEDAVWNAALEAAESVGQSLQSLVRRRVLKILQEAGLL